MAAKPKLTDLPDTFSVNFWPTNLTLRQRIRAKSFATEKYISDVSLESGDGGQITINGKIFRSQSKSSDPHTVTFTVDREKVTDAQCSCKAGYDQ